MQVVAKTPHIEFSFKGTKEALLDIVERLKGAYPIRIQKRKSEEYTDWETSALNKKISARLHSGSAIRVDLFNAGMTQKQLADATGILQPHISQMIAGKRPVSPENAKKLAKIFKREVKRYRGGL